MGSGIDLHMHTNASDGTDSPADLIRKVQSQGIRILALTDHDTADGLRELEEGKNLASEGLWVISGIEFSCLTASGRKCHILGYAYDRKSAAFQSVLEKGRELRRKKLEARLAFLEDRGIRLPEEEVEGLRRLSSAGKPHLANLMVSLGYAESKEQAIREVLDQCHAEGRIQAEIAVQGILASGGVPVWAHPLGGEGEKRMAEERFQETLDELCSLGIRGLECWYSRYPLERCRWLVQVATKRGLLISGGSDYHGKNKDIPMGQLNAEGAEVPADTLTLLSSLSVSRR